MAHPSNPDPVTTLTIKLPQLGEGADAGEVIEILVAVGDRVARGQTIIELENAKAVAPIPSPHAGTVTEILVREGETIAVGAAILNVQTDAEVEPAPEEAQKNSSPTEAAPPRSQGGKPVAKSLSISGLPPAASPTVRRFARELEIDLRQISGSERGGRVVLSDLRDFIHGFMDRTTNPAEPIVAPPATAPDYSRWGPVTRKPFSGLRKTIATRLTRSWTTIPHVTQFDSADITELLALKKKHAPAYQERSLRLTLTGLIIQALIPCLREHPAMNASLDLDRAEVVYKDHFHLGIAVDSEHGLTVPVIRDADKKTLSELSDELVTLGERARSRQLALSEMEGGTFTISNQGGIGGEHFTPIVNAPEVAILGVGKGRQRPAISDGEICPRTFVPLSLSYDHRLIDGGTAARFISQLVSELENFDETRMEL